MRCSFFSFSCFTVLSFSGAGKSTFLSLLSGKTEPTAGQLEVNGEKTSLTKFKKLVGFVPQEDIMLRELTVEENIRHSAFMRLPAEWTRKQKLQRVEAVMESLELTPIKDSIIGDEIRRGVSGGQRKRVNVAMELVADPSLLALDEPTSGLDSTTSYALTETLHSLAKTGVNVAAVLHQPKNEIFEVSFSNRTPKTSHLFHRPNLIVTIEMIVSVPHPTTADLTNLSAYVPFTLVSLLYGRCLTTSYYSE